MINSSTLLLTWHAPGAENTNGILRHYLAEITDSISMDQIINTTDETHLLVVNLQPNHKYIIRVAILTNVRGPFSEAITVTMQGKIT